MAPPVKVCWALTAAGSSRLTRERTSRLNFNWAKRRGVAEGAANDMIETSDRAELGGALGEE
jgi:hypothetical protein